MAFELKVCNEKKSIECLFIYLFILLVEFYFLNKLLNYVKWLRKFLRLIKSDNISTLIFWTLSEFNIPNANIIPSAFSSEKFSFMFAVNYIFFYSQKYHRYE